MNQVSWPTAELDPVRRLRVLDGALPGVHLAERDVEASFDDVWAILSDFERTVPLFDPLVGSLRVIRRGRRGLDVVAVTKGVPVPFRLELRRSVGGGTLWMQAPARGYLVATAVAAGPDATRLAHLEGVPRLKRRRPAWLARHVQSDLDNLARLASRT